MTRYLTNEEMDEIDMAYEDRDAARANARRLKAENEKLRQWRPFKDAPRDGRWIIAVCNDRVTIHRISWGVGRAGEVGWCTDTRFLGVGNIFEPAGGWIDWPDQAQLNAQNKPF